MPSRTPQQVAKNAQRNIAAAIGFVAVLMLGASFAAVPLYRMFCAATGYGGTTQTADRAPASRGLRQISVRFDANVGPGLNWRVDDTQPVSINEQQRPILLHTRLLQEWMQSGLRGGK